MNRERLLALADAVRKDAEGYMGSDDLEEGNKTVCQHGKQGNKCKKCKAIKDLKKAATEAFGVVRNSEGVYEYNLPYTVDVAKSATAAAEEMRYTMGVLYAPDRLDAHNEFTTDDQLHKAVIDFSRRGNKVLRWQHRPDRVAGEIVEILRWPQESTITVQIPGHIEKATEVTMPAGTVYVGVIWTDEAWPEVKTGRIRGFSLGGRGIRVRGVQKESAPGQRMNGDLFKAKDGEDDGDVEVKVKVKRRPSAASGATARAQRDRMAQAQRGVSSGKKEREYERQRGGKFAPKGQGVRPGQGGEQQPGNRNVAQIQRSLEALGIDTGEVDGMYGPKTKAAIMEFQRENGLIETGTVGPATLKALAQAMREKGGNALDTGETQTAEEVRSSGLKWGGKRFHSRKDLARWLKDKGEDIKDWEKKHPDAARGLKARSLSSGVSKKPVHRKTKRDIDI